jgi:peptide/nickel transport system ATP-binding protein
MQTLGRLQSGLGAAVVLIGHDMGLIAQFADTVGVMYAGRLVEIGPVAQMIAAPRHPYTRLLIDSLPGIDAKRRLTGIPGLPPRLTDMPPGCAFAPRCPLATASCTASIPALQTVALGHRAACHLYPGLSALPPLTAKAAP